MSNETKVPSIPEVPATSDASLRRFLDAVRQVIQVREGNRGDALDAVVTYRDLVEGGLATYLKSGDAISLTPTTVTDLTQPPLVEGLSTAGALASIILTWVRPEYKNHSHTEIWRAQENDITKAAQVGMASGGLYVDYVSKNTTGFSYYYWARNVSIYGVKGEFNTSGVLGKTSPDPTALLELLNGNLAESSLTSALLTRINLIDDNKTYTTSVTSRIDAAKADVQKNIDTLSGVVTTSDNLLSKQIGQVSTDLTNTTKTLTDSDTSIIQTINAYKTTVADTYATITSTNTSFAAVNKAIADNNTAINTKVDNLSSSVSTSLTSLSATDATLAASITTLRSDTANTYATITSLDSTAATLNSSITGVSNTLSSKYDSLSTTVAANKTTADNAIAKEITDRTDADNAIVISTSSSISALSKTVADNQSSTASSIKTLTSRIDTAGGKDSSGKSITMEQAFTTQATVNTGLLAQYTVKINNSTDKYVTGFGLSSTSVNGTTVGEFAIIADKFSIAPVATDPAAADGSPFYHLTAPAVINGVTVPAGTYMKKAFIAAATIGTAEIADAAITNAKVANLNASKINFNEATGEYFSAAVIKGGSISGTTITGNTIKGGSIEGSHVWAGGTEQYPAVEMVASGVIRANSETMLGGKPAVVTEMSSGNVIRNVLFPNGVGEYIYQPTQALSRIEAGVVANNTEVILPGYWEEVPRVIVSINSMQLYESTSAGVDQKVVCTVDKLSKLSTDVNSPGYYQYKFTPLAYLTTSASDGTISLLGQTVVVPAAYNIPAGNFDSSSFTLPANTSYISVPYEYKCWYTTDYNAGNGTADGWSVTITPQLYVNGALVATGVAVTISYTQSPQNIYGTVFTFNFTTPPPTGTAFIRFGLTVTYVKNNSSSAYDLAWTYGSYYRYVRINGVSVLATGATGLASGTLSYLAIGR